MVFYEAMWFMDHDGLIQDDFEETFESAEAALKYYEEHKNDEDKYGWKVTKRGRAFKVLKYYINDWKKRKYNLIKEEHVNNGKYQYQKRNRRIKTIHS